MHGAPERLVRTSLTPKVFWRRLKDEEGFLSWWNRAQLDRNDRVFTRFVPVYRGQDHISPPDRLYYFFSEPSLHESNTFLNRLWRKPVSLPDGCLVQDKAGSE